MSTPAFCAATADDELIVDAHVHVGLDKYRPLEEFEHAAEHASVQRAVLVQHMGQFDNGYLADCVKRAPARYAGIAMVDTDHPDVLEAIERVAQDGAFAGIRLEARVRSQGDPYQVWRAISDAGMVASVRGPLEDILDPSFAELLQELPDLTIRLEHGAFFHHSTHRTDDLEKLLALAQRECTFLMWSGYYDFSAQPHPHPDALPFLRESLHAFGSPRIMWSGDWNRNDLDPLRPVGYYDDAREYVSTVFPELAPHDLGQIMGRTALAYISASRTLVAEANES